MRRPIWAAYFYASLQPAWADLLHKASTTLCRRYWESYGIAVYHPCKDYGTAVYGVVHTVIQTQSFEAAAKSAKMGDDEVAAIVDYVARNPTGGDLMVGTGGVRKARIAKPGTGKSGGYRVIWWFGGNDIPVFLLTAFGKSEKDNLSKAERNALHRLTATLRESLDR